MMSEKTAWQKAADKASEDLEGFGMAAENVILKRRIAELEKLFVDNTDPCQLWESEEKVWNEIHRRLYPENYDE